MNTPNLRSQRLMSQKTNELSSFDSRLVMSLRCRLSFYQLVREKDFVEWWNGDIHDALSFSGPYVFTSKEDQKQSIFLARNPYYTHTNRPFFFDQVRFGFWAENREIYKIITPDIILSDTDSDWKNAQWNKYIRPVFQGVFINAARVPLSLRKSLYQDILGTIDIKRRFSHARRKCISRRYSKHSSYCHWKQFLSNCFSTRVQLWWDFSGARRYPNCSYTKETTLLYHKSWQCLPSFCLKCDNRYPMNCTRWNEQRSLSTTTHFVIL
jgi:hypothetical protein